MEVNRKLQKAEKNRVNSNKMYIKYYTKCWIKNIEKRKEIRYNLIYILRDIR